MGLCNRAFQDKLDRSAHVVPLQTCRCHIAKKIGLALHKLRRYSQASYCLLTCIPETSAKMAPKSGDKKPAQPAKKAVAKKSTGGRKKGSKKAIESYKIYIYKVPCACAACVATAAIGLSVWQVTYKL